MVLGAFLKQVSYAGGGPCADEDVCAPAVAATLAGAAVGKSWPIDR